MDLEEATKMAKRHEATYNDDFEHYGDIYADDAVVYRPVQGATHDKATKGDEMPLIVDYWAPWCGPCRMMAPEFARVSGAVLWSRSLSTRCIARPSIRHRSSSADTRCS